MISHLDREVFRKSVKKLKKDTATEMAACCPACGDTKNRLHLVDVPMEGFSYIKCWNQGCELEEPTSVLRFLNIINSPLLGMYKQKTLKSRIQEIKEDQGLQSILNKIKTKKPSEQSQPEKVAKTLEKEIPKLLLDKFELAKDVPECVQYLKERNIDPLDDWLFSKDRFFIFNDKRLFVQDYLIIPIYNKVNKFRGWYSRSIKEKKFSTFLLPDTPKFWQLDPTQEPEIVTEGILDALSTGFDRPGAAISADIPEIIRDTLPRDTIIAFDNDKTGIAKSIEYAKDFRIFVWPEVPYKDFNEMLGSHSKEDIKEMILSNIYSGIQAETRLRMKEV